PYNVESITFTPVANHSFAILSGEYNNVVLTEGVAKDVVIKVTAQDGTTTKEYKVTVTRQKCTDNTLKGLTTDKGQLSPAFSSFVVDYTINVPYEIDKITLAPVANHATATLSSDYTNKALAVGNNTIEITVTAQDGTPKVYTVTVIRAEASTDATLKELGLSTGTLSPVFNSATTEYTVTVPYNVESITFTPVANHSFAILSGEYNNVVLTEGVAKDVVIKVTAQAGGEPKEYKVTVTRQKCTDNTLKGLTTDKGQLSPAFSSSVVDYTINVPYEIDKITLTPVANHATATLSSDYTNKALAVGNNTIEIIVKAQDGTEKKYTVTVVRAEASTDATLKELGVSEGTLSPKFNSATEKYTVNVPYKVSTITITAKVNHSKATMSNAHTNVALVAGEAKDIKITVTAESGATKTYTVTVTRGLPSTDASLKKLDISSGKLAPAFDPTKLEYTVNVPFTTKTFTLTPVQNFAEAKLSGTYKNVTLKEGENKLRVVVTAEDGKTKKEYVVNVIRAESEKINDLTSLEIEGIKLDKEFSSSVTEYSVTVPYTTGSITVKFAKAGNFSTVNVKSPYKVTLVAGKVNDVVIEVKSQAGQAKKYVIHVTRTAAATDSTLEYITPFESKLIEEFDPAITEYTMKVSTRIENMDFNFEPANEFATAKIEGQNKLVLGENTFKITVTAQDGSKTVYTIVVTQVELPDDAKLSSLKVNGEEVKLSDDVREYIFALPIGTKEALIEYVTSDEFATAVLEGDTVLNEDGVDNIFNITVTAQDGTESVYTLQIYFRELETESTLIDLWDDRHSFEFDPEVTEYAFDVPYYVQSLTFGYTCAGDYAKVAVYGPEKLLADAENEFTIIVTAEDESYTVYKVVVTRKMMTDVTKLDTLVPSFGALDFVSEVTEYKLSVPYSVSTVTFTYTAKDENAVVTVKGVDELTVGAINVFEFKVEVENGDYTVYTVEITRDNISTDSKLSSIVLNSSAIEGFDPDVFEYVVEIPNSVSSVMLEYVCEHIMAKASVTSKPEELIVGENVYVITVIAEDEITTTEYTVKVIRADVDSDSTLSGLNSNVGEIEFDPAKTDYEINVENDVTSQQ
ncbi:MAG: cadherin-like beta sandwich domain-containing protein, partial [Clostridiales bacterium]|nr:cadherin-like beta sandwich domain-containing protein [Clostridiales bacterium]